MKNFWQKFTQSKVVQAIVKFFNKINRPKVMPIIWLTLLVVVLTYVSSLLKISKVLRIGIIFLIINNIIAYNIGKLIRLRELKRWWLLLLPIVFALVILSHYAKYNLVLSGSYLILELLGLISDQFYNDPKQKDVLR